MLKVLLPTTLPTAMSRPPLIAAITEVATSGIEVPAAMNISSVMRANSSAPIFLWPDGDYRLP
jgi:hypothetical protein